MYWLICLYVLQTDVWRCETCTYLKLPYRPSCYLCSSDRPADYQIPADYVPQEEEQRFLDSEAAGRVALEEVSDSR